MYYPPTWLSLAALGTLLALVVAIPPAADAVPASLWLGVTVPVATVLHGASMYFLASRPAALLGEHVAKGRKPVPASTAKELRRLEKAAFALMERTEQLKLRGPPGGAAAELLTSLRRGSLSVAAQGLLGERRRSAAVPPHVGGQAEEPAAPPLVAAPPAPGAASGSPSGVPPAAEVSEARHRSVAPPPPSAAVEDADACVHSRSSSLPPAASQYE